MGVMGWDLYSTLQDQVERRRYYDTIPPVACPNDGEPLIPAPREGELYCKFDGFLYPRDWNPETMSGM
jgi:hypothetical protein